MTRGSGKGTRIEKPTQTAPGSVDLVNPGTAGLVYDEAGHSVGGGSRVTLDGDPDAVAMRQLSAGHLLAQRGDTWLQVRDGQLAEPDTTAGGPTGSSSGEAGDAPGPAPRNDTSGGTTDGETERPAE